MNTMRSILPSLILATLCLGCLDQKKPYGVEQQHHMSGAVQRVWAVAPAINLSGQSQVDPLLQADLLFNQLQQVEGLTVIPVNRVVQIYASLNIEKVQSEQQASLVCDLLGCEALVVPTVTFYDPYDPPKIGASLHLFFKPGGYVRPVELDPRQLARSASPLVSQSLPDHPSFIQAVGMFDGSSGAVRQALSQYAAGRNDPNGPLGAKEYLVSVDRFNGFVYHQLIGDLLREQAPKENPNLPMVPPPSSR